MNCINSYKVTTFSLAAVMLILSLTMPLFVIAQDNTAKTNAISKNRIHEERFILINGINQWVTIKGERSKPVILFLHGGPGSP